MTECARCGHEPCSCQKAAGSTKVLKYVYQSCGAPGCTVVVKSVAGQQQPFPICKWCLSGTAYLNHHIKPESGSGPLMTRDEFGMTLYDAIKTIGGLLSATSDTARAKLVTQWEHARAILIHDELTQILARSPWVRDL